MSTRKKLLSKARNSPDGLRFDEICRLAEAFGWRFARQRGSHRIYDHPAYSHLVMNFQDRDGRAKGYQVKQLVKAIDEVIGEVD